MLAAGQSCVKVAKTLGYHGAAGFSSAFLAIFKMRPSAYAKSVNAPKPKRAEGKRILTKRGPKHVGAKPLPRFDAKPKPPKKSRKKKPVA
jgi:hypothetical protein